MNLSAVRRILLKEWEHDSYQNRGAMSRELLLWGAIAQYLNSGGELRYNVMLLDELNSSPNELPTVDLPEGFILLRTQRVWFEDEDGARDRAEHLFINQEAREAFRWIEDVEATRMSMQQLADDLENDGEPELFDDP